MPMCMDALYRLNLKALGIEPLHERLVLHDDFFRNFEQTEILGGEVEVDYTLLKKNDAFNLKMSLTGFVQVSCDRCLDCVDIPIKIQDDVNILMGKEANEDSEPVIVSETEGMYNLGWRILETILLSLPLERVHNDGECNKEMMNLLSEHLIQDVNETNI